VWSCRGSRSPPGEKSEKSRRVLRHGRGTAVAGLEKPTLEGLSFGKVTGAFIKKERNKFTSTKSWRGLEDLKGGQELGTIEARLKNG